MLAGGRLQDLRENKRGAGRHALPGLSLQGVHELGQDTDRVKG